LNRRTEFKILGETKNWRFYFTTRTFPTFLSFPSLVAVQIR
jgi:hypothetical protein